MRDIGVIAIPSGAWDEPGEWSISQRERARTHPYLTERMLARILLLAQVGHCAAPHHERLDGSGYPCGLRGEAIWLPARILGAADVYDARQRYSCGSARDGPTPRSPPSCTSAGGRSPRTEAALFAMRHGLIGTAGEPGT